MIFIPFYYVSIIYLAIILIWILISYIKTLTKRQTYYTLFLDWTTLSLVSIFLLISFYVIYNVAVMQGVIASVVLLCLSFIMRRRYRHQLDGELKFSGISSTHGTSIWSNNYHIHISKNKKYTIKKKKMKSRTHLIFLIFPLIDVINYLIVYEGLTLEMSTLDPISPDGLTGVSLFISISFFIFLIYLGLYFIAYLIRTADILHIKDLPYWHGLEHKLISSAQHNDVDNVKNYSPIVPDCGGTYMFTILIFYAIYLLFNIFFIGQWTLLFLAITFEMRHVHKYNKIGLWLGKKIQEKLTVKEPHDWQLELGIKPMKKLLELERIK